MSNRNLSKPIKEEEEQDCIEKKKKNWTGDIIIFEIIADFVERWHFQYTDEICRDFCIHRCLLTNSSFFVVRTRMHSCYWQDDVHCETWIFIDNMRKYKMKGFTGELDWIGRCNVPRSESPKSTKKKDKSKKKKKDKKHKKAEVSSSDNESNESDDSRWANSSKFLRNNCGCSNVFQHFLFVASSSENEAKKKKKKKKKKSKMDVKDKHEVGKFRSSPNHHTCQCTTGILAREAEDAWLLWFGITFDLSCPFSRFHQVVCLSRHFSELVQLPWFLRPE